MSALQEQIAADQQQVFFADFSVPVLLQGKTVRGLLVDKAAGGGVRGQGLVVLDPPGTHVLRKRLQVMAAEIDWTPVEGMELEMDGDVWIVEHLGYERPVVIWDIHLYRYLA